MFTSELKYLILITIIFVAACIETDIYLPAFPDMMAYFSISEEKIQSLLTWNFVGICVSGPFYGPLSDSFGRKKPLIAALGLFLLGSILTLFAHDFDLMLWGRVLQGLGSGGCFTLGMAILFDVFQEQKAVDAMNKLNTIIPFIMAAAPMLGGFLNHFYGFRSNFLAIALCVLVSFAICLIFFQESLPVEKRAEFETKKILNDFKKVFASAPFWQMTLIVSLIFGGYLAFLSGVSVLFVIEFGVSKQVLPFFQAALLGAWLCANLTFNRVINRGGPEKIKKLGINLIVVGGVGIVAAVLLDPTNPYLVTCFMMFYAFGANWVQAIYFPEGMEIFPEIKGVTSSLLTSARLLITAFVVGLASALYDGTIYPIVGVVAAGIAIMLVTIYYYEKNRQHPRLVLETEGINAGASASLH